LPRLRRVDCAGPGFTRRRRGRGFEYVDRSGKRIGDPVTIRRIRELAIPPAWNDVWICSDPWGHIQAVGTDAAGRKQYLYHERWRAHRDRQKFARMLEFARALPSLRRRVARHLRRPDLDRERVLACAVRLLDHGFFRIGSESYADENGSYGLATLLRRHVTVRDGVATFDYPAKGGARRRQAISDRRAVTVLDRLKRRRGGGDELLAYRDGRRWVDVRSEDINGYLKDATGQEFTAKDFRTWTGTLLAAVAIGSQPVPVSKTARKRTEAAAVRTVAGYLGNTPAVCRASYIDPRVFDRFHAGATIRPALDVPLEDEELDIAVLHGAVEEAVVELLEDAPPARAA
jgi:DNA topoisomerase I